MKKFLATLIMLYATAIDGDSIKYGSQEVRLSGIDAPEYHQNCFDKDGKEYHCGDLSFKHLQQLLKKKVNCKIIEYDRYDRGVAICDDVNKQMVLDGWATHYYNDDYKKEELDAKKNKRGLWQGKFLRPEFYRALNRK
ncbi:MAG: thermonuclease family protein [Alphaproteobacteria bacterium]